MDEVLSTIKTNGENGEDKATIRTGNNFTNYDFLYLDENAPAIDYALSYIKAGWKIIPTYWDKKQNEIGYAVKWGSKWIEDEETAIDYWNKYPYAGIAILTGEKSGVTVIDTDKHEHDGFVTRRDLEKELGELPETLTVLTPRDGEHQYFRYVSDVKSNAGEEAFGAENYGMDLRSDKGVVIAPPTRKYIEGNWISYRWDAGSEIIAELPETWKKHIRNVSNQKNSNKGTADGKFELPEVIGETTRNATLFKYVCSQRGKGVHTLDIWDSLQTVNSERCKPPLEEKELKALFNSATKKEYDDAKENLIITSEDGDTSGQATTQTIITEDGRVLPVANLVSMAAIEEKEVEWLIDKRMPKGVINTIFADGGSGKGSICCSLIADLSAGRKTVMEDSDPHRQPMKCLILTSEDDAESVLKPRLRKNGANMDNIKVKPLNDEELQKMKFDSELFEGTLYAYRPDVVLIDPIQSFIGNKVNMSARNECREQTNYLVRYGKLYGVTFIVVVHSNKSASTGRNKMSDSSDLWDVSRSVHYIGVTVNNKELRFISHEKCNYGARQPTVLFEISEETGIPVVKGTTQKDADDILSERKKTSQTTLEECKGEMLEYLKDGANHLSDEMTNYLKGLGYSDNAIQDARSALKQDGKIKIWKGKKEDNNRWLIKLRSSAE